MGEYFNWVNVDKKEYLCPADFDLGNKRLESLFRGNSLLVALHTLLADEWNGDHILTNVLFRIILIAKHCVF